MAPFATLGGTSYVRGGSGEPVVLIHNLGGTIENWRYVRPALESSFDVIAYDLRGAGRNDTQPQPSTLDDLVGHLEVLREGLGIERLALVGHSLGGAIALRYAADYPRRVSAVVAVGAVTTLPDAARQAMEERAATAAAHGLDGIADMAVESATAPSFRSAFPDRAACLAALLRGSDPAAYSALCRIVAELDIVEELARVEAPVLLIRGAEDAVLPRERTADDLRRLRRARCVELERCGHIVTWEQPEALVELVTSFLLADGRAHG